MKATMDKINESDDFIRQQNYYARTAHQYDCMHVSADSEHDLALFFLGGYARFLGAKSILDIGSGTGRALRHFRNDLPSVRCVGIDPSEKLRQVGIEKYSIPPEDLIDGNALSIDFPDESFDIVSEFGVLHHIRTPSVAVQEMLRVARKAVVISDINNFGQGSLIGRSIKQALNASYLWPLVNLIKTKGKGYTITEGDGLAYSYSVYNNWNILTKHCKEIYSINTNGKSLNHYRSASHVMIIGVK